MMNLFSDLDFKRKKVIFEIDQGTLDRLDYYCKFHGVTRSKLLRRLISDFLFESLLFGDSRCDDENN